MTHDEIDLFRRARPETPAHDPAAKARLRTALASQDIEEKPVTKHNARRFVAVGALTAAAVVGVTVVQNVEWGGAPQPGGRPGTPFVLGPVANAEAGALADKAIRKADADQATKPRPDQWSYVKTTLAMSSKGTGGRLFGAPDRRLTSERWNKVDGTRSAGIERGGLRVRTLSDMERNTSPRSDYPYLLNLPTDPKVLLDTVYKVAAEENAGGAPDDRSSTSDLGKASSRAPSARDVRAFEIIEVFMRDAALPPKLRAAMYGALAKIPGIRYEAKAADIAGRPGVTLYVIKEGYLRSEILIDPRTYDYLGFRNIVTRSNRSTTEHGRVLRDKPGTILGWGGRIAGGIVDKPGQRS